MLTRLRSLVDMTTILGQPDQQRRLPVSLGRGSVHPKLLQCVQQNDLVWKTLHELKAVYPEKGSSKAKPPKVSGTGRLFERFDSSALKLT